MNFAHVHILLNHIPILGTLFGFILYVIAVARRDEDLKKICWGIFVVVALLAIPTYLTGDPAADIVKDLPGVEKSVIERHDDAATASFVALCVLGAASLGALLWIRRSKFVPAWASIALLALSLITTGMMAWTGNLGGQIRHSEIRSGTVSPPHAE